jgi:hypothetical protein
VSLGGKPLTKADEARRSAIHAGHCMACYQRGIDLRGQGLVQFHHLLSGGRRIGHQATIGLCCWHHMAQPFFGYSHEEMRDEYGPSLAEGSKPFHAVFGSDEVLLRMQNEFLREAA